MTGDTYTASCTCPGCWGCRHGGGSLLCGRPCHENSEGGLCVDCWLVLNPPLVRSAWPERRKAGGHD